jgi:aldehyde dehydrogenase (NAD+)
MWEYVKRAKQAGARSRDAARPDRAPAAIRAPARLPPIDRTPKLFIAGKQARPDGAYTRRIVSPSGAGRRGARGQPQGHPQRRRSGARGEGLGTRDRAQPRADPLLHRREPRHARGEFAARIDAMTECGAKAARQEVEASIARLFTYGAWADKYDGAVHSVPIRGVAIAMNEPIGVIGIACGDASRCSAWCRSWRPRSPWATRPS